MNLLRILKAECIVSLEPSLLNAISDPTVKELFLAWITFTYFNVALALHDVEYTN